MPLIAAALLWASHPPVGFGLLAPVAFALQFRSATKTTRPSLVWATFSLAFFLGHLYWIGQFGWYALVALALEQALFWVAAGVAIHRWIPKSNLLLQASVFMAFDWLRGHFPWGGFGWGDPGAAMGAVPGLRLLGGSIGATGLGLIVVVLGIVGAQLLGKSTVRWRPIAAFVAVIVVFGSTDALLEVAGNASSRPMRVAAVQGNVPRPELPNFTEQRQRVFEGHLAPTRKIRGVDLIVWGEDAIGTSTPGSPRADVSELARQLKTPILAGVSQLVGSSFVNTMQLFRPDPATDPAYVKRHAVPFGEYVPLPFLRGVVGSLDRIPYDLQTGDELTMFDVDGVTIATPICFESTFARDTRAFARAGAEVFVYATNDSAFERTASADQHLAQTRMRSLETRRWGIQVALSGRTAVIAPDGRISRTTDLFTSEVVRATLHSRTQSTLYTRVGDLFQLLILVGSLTVARWGRLRGSDETS